MPKHHDLKLFDDNYQPIADGRKRSDIRFNDRNYQVDDTITYSSGYPDIAGFYCDGRTIDVIITHVDDGFWSPDENYVNLSIKLIDDSEVVK
jgi:hypothetical protein